MMVYLSVTLWLLAIVGCAWGVQRLWGGMIRAKIFNALVLPGTLVAQLGHVMGLLVTGATVSNTSLFKDDESGEPETTRDPKPRIPVIGPVVIGLLPLLACAAGIYVVARLIGTALLGNVTPTVVKPTLPTSMPALWDLLRDQISLMESVVAAGVRLGAQNWKIAAMLYLLVCFAVRMAPLPGNVRGSIGAILVMGVGLAAAASLLGAPEMSLGSGWIVMNLTIAVLLFLLLLSLLIRGSVLLVKHLRGA